MLFIILIAITLNNLNQVKPTGSAGPTGPTGHWEDPKYVNEGGFFYIKVVGAENTYLSWKEGESTISKHIGTPDYSCEFRIFSSGNNNEFYLTRRDNNEIVKFVNYRYSNDPSRQYPTNVYVGDFDLNSLKGHKFRFNDGDVSNPLVNTEYTISYSPSNVRVIYNNEFIYMIFGYDKTVSPEIVKAYTAGLNGYLTVPPNNQVNPIYPDYAIDGQTLTPIKSEIALCPKIPFVYDELKSQISIQNGTIIQSKEEAVNKINEAYRNCHQKFMFVRIRFP